MASPVQVRTEAPNVTPPGDTPPTNKQGRLSWDSVTAILLPLLVLTFFLILWQVLPGVFGLHAYEVPTLGQTLQGLHDDWSQIGTALLVTLQDAVLGFIIGNGLAILGATLFSYSRQLERAFYPIAIIVQTIPILVYAPIFVIIFFKIPFTSNQSQSVAVVAVAVLITFFPTLVNMTVGLKTIDPRVYELMRLLNASKTQIFLKLRFPSSTPFLFSSLKITSTLAFVGALVGEFMVGGGFNPIGHLLAAAGLSTVFGFPTDPADAQGVGYQLQVFYSQLDKPGIFADVLVISAMSILFFGLMILLERWLVPWQKTQ
jgi:NitT/TauT family transport system permease protein